MRHLIDKAVALLMGEAKKPKPTLVDWEETETNTVWEGEYKGMEFYITRSLDDDLNSVYYLDVNDKRPTGEIVDSVHATLQDAKDLAEEFAESHDSPLPRGKAPSPEDFE